MTADHGTLGLSSPWCRQAFTDDERREVAALIPEGCSIYIAAHAHGRRRSFIIEGRVSNVAVARWEHRFDVVHAARLMAERLASAA